MEPFVRVIPDQLHLRPEQHLLKAQDYLALITAEQILEDAKRQAQKILLEAGQEYEQQKRLGHEMGMNQAKQEVAEQMLNIVEQNIRYFEQVEKKVMMLVMAAVSKILGEFDDEELLIRVVRNALQLMRDQKQVTLRVAPAQENAVQHRLNEVLGSYRGISYVEVIADPRLKIGDCILESEVGVVDASVEVQMNALEKIMKSRIEAAY